MKKPRATARTTEDRLREQLAEAKSNLQTQQQITAAQQSEIEQMREMVRELSAPKPGRAFRTRRLPLDRLDVTVKGTDITEDEVVIEQGRGFITIRVGDAIGGDVEIRPRLVNYATNEPYQPIAPAAVPPPQVARAANDIRTTTRDVYDASLSASQTFQDGDPSVVNASLAPQADPRMPSVSQLEPEVGVAQRYGWVGAGPKPRGWQDPDAKPPETTH